MNDREASGSQRILWDLGYDDGVRGISRARLERKDAQDLYDLGYTSGEYRASALRAHKLQLIFFWIAVLLTVAGAYLILTASFV